MPALTKFLRPKFVAALCRGLYHKLGSGGALKFSLGKVFLGPRLNLEIADGGSIRFLPGRRVYISRDCELKALAGQITIAEGVFLNRGCSVASMARISIGAHTMLGPNVILLDHDHSFDPDGIPYQQQPYKLADISVGRNVWLGANTVVTKGSVIGDNTVVAANSVVRGALEPNSLYAGAPAVLKRTLAPSASPARP